MKFGIKDLIEAFTEEILSGKLHILFSVSQRNTRKSSSSVFFLKQILTFMLSGKQNGTKGIKPNWKYRNLQT